MNVPAEAPKPDERAIADFVEVVFSGLMGFVPFRIIGEKGGPRLVPQAHCVPVGEDLTRTLCEHADQAARSGAGLFIAPATMPTRGRAIATSFGQTAVVVVDLDAGDIDLIREHLVRHLGEPTLEVASGGLTPDGKRKLHLYWGLAAPASGPDLGKVCRLRGRLAEKVGGDLSFAKPSQLIRVAGSVHAKHGKCTPVEIISRTPATYDLECLEQAVAAMPEIQGRAGGRVERKLRAKDLMLRSVRANGADGVTRHEALTRIIGHWVRQARLGDVTCQGAWSAVVDHNAAMIVPPWSDQDLRREFDALLARDRSKHVEGENAGEQTCTTEDGLARAFAAANAVKYRYADGDWLEWTGTYWKQAARERVLESVRAHCRSVALRTGSPSDRRMHSLRLVKAIEELTRGDQRLAFAACEPEPMLLNTPGGIVDLSTGETRANDPSEQMCQITTAVPGSRCPRWLRFIEDITEGDKELEAYLGRIAGYCLTGDVSEQVFFFLHGPGGNGKSTFVSIIAAVLGTYARTAAFETFTATKSDRHPTELAALRGARLVGAVENDHGRAFSESRVKALTGSDRIAARLMRADFSEFRPTCKLMFAGNHMPRVRPDEAMRRRLQRVPLRARITEEKRVRNLEAQLLEERDGILGWMIAGCIDWQRRGGLAPPRSVVEAGTGYFEEQDQIGQWLDDACDRVPGDRTTSQVLYASYRAWAEAAGVQPGSMSDLVVDLKTRGFGDFRTSKSRGLLGIVVRSSEETEAAE